MAGKFALIIGNSQYQDPNLTRLKAPEADVEGLSALLRDPHIGAFDEVITLANEMSATIRRTIAHFFAQKATDDLLLLYFSGHGVLDDRGELFLATRDTERELISGTAIPAAYITGEMDRSRSKRQVLILDCCHSGAFARGSKGVVGASVGTASAFEGTGYGRVVLTATDATQFAWEGDQVIGSAENSVFTHYVIEGLRTGQADTDGDGRISIENLYDYVYDQVVRTTPKQTPGKWSYKQQGEIIIANNPRPVTKPAELPRELREAIDDARPWVREGAIHELERLLNGRHPGLALAALDALKHLADDDSRRVANAATRVLNAYEEAKRVQEQARVEQEPLARAPAEAEREARGKVEADRVAREKAEQVRLAREKAEKVATERMTVPERKEAANGTRRVVLVAGILVVSLCGLVCIAFSINALAPKAPTPAPTVPLAAFVPTAAPTQAAAPPTAAPTKAAATTAPTTGATGNLDALVAAAKQEGQLTVIALPHDWCGYGDVIAGFQKKYGLKINELNPDAGSGDEVEAIKANKDNKGPQAPDVIDVGLSFGLSAKNDKLIQPYKVATWDTIPADAKDAEGYWYGDYYGVLAFQINADIVKTLPQDWNDLLKPDYKGQVALAGDPRASNQAIQGVYAAGLANGGTADNAGQPGLDFFAKLNKAGNFVPVIGKAASLAKGETPILIRWDYNALADRDTLKGNPKVEVVVPKSGVVAGVYVQAISAYAPHPNAAKLWMEYLYSDEGQLGWLAGYCHPIRFNDLSKSGKIPAAMLSKLPPADNYAKAIFPTLDQQNKNKELITKQWDTVVGANVR